MLEQPQALWESNQEVELGIHLQLIWWDIFIWLTVPSKRTKMLLAGPVYERLHEILLPIVPTGPATQHKGSGLEFIYYHEHILQCLPKKKKNRQAVKKIQELKYINPETSLENSSNRQPCTTPLPYQILISVQSKCKFSPLGKVSDNSMHPTVNAQCIFLFLFLLGSMKQGCRLPLFIGHNTQQQ